MTARAVAHRARAVALLLAVPLGVRAQAAADPWTPVVAEAERAARRGAHDRAREAASRLLAARAGTATAPAAARLAEGRAWDEAVARIAP